MKIFAFIFSFFMLVALNAAVAAYPSFSEMEYLMNRGSSANAKIQLGTQLTKKKVQVLRAHYKYSRDGGAVGDIALKDEDGKAAVLPDNAIIKQVLIDVITAPTSGGSATVALKAQSAGDLKGATAIASITGLVAGVPVGSAATMIKLTAQRTVYATVATAALTAGEFYVFIEYYLSE